MYRYDQRFACQLTKSTDDSSKGHVHNNNMYIPLLADTEALSEAATFALIRAEEMRLAGILFCDASDCITPEEWAFIDWRRAD